MSEFEMHLHLNPVGGDRSSLLGRLSFHARNCLLNDLKSPNTWREVELLMRQERCINVLTLNSYHDLDISCDVQIFVFVYVSLYCSLCYFHV